MTTETLKNYYGGQWVASIASEILPVHNPATNEVIGQVPLSSPSEVDQAIQAASAAFDGWRRTPAANRIQPLFKLKELLEEHFDDLARVISMENGKTLGESGGEMRRAPPRQPPRARAVGRSPCRWPATTPPDPARPRRLAAGRRRSARSPIRRSRRCRTSERPWAPRFRGLYRVSTSLSNSRSAPWRRA